MAGPNPATYTLKYLPEKEVPIVIAGTWKWITGDGTAEYILASSPADELQRDIKFAGYTMPNSSNQSFMAFVEMASVNDPLRWWWFELPTDTKDPKDTKEKTWEIWTAINDKSPREFVGHGEIATS